MGEDEPDLFPQHFCNRFFLLNKLFDHNFSLVDQTGLGSCQGFDVFVDGREKGAEARVEGNLGRGLERGLVQQSLFGKGLVGEGADEVGVNLVHY